MRLRPIQPTAGLLVLCLGASSMGGCAHRPSGADAVMALGAVAMVAGLLVAGGCGDRDERTEGCGSDGGGHPEIGAPLAVAGLAAMAAASEAKQEAVGPRKPGAKGATPTSVPPAPTALDPNPRVMNEPLVGTPVLSIVR